MRILGMISGTSFDGIDVACGDFDTDGNEITLKPVGFNAYSYSEQLHSDIARALPPAAIDMKTVCELDTRIGQAFALAALEAIHSFAPSVEFIVSHGQTMYHWISESGTALGTLQLGEPSWIAERTGVSVISNVRSRDVVASGQGAPLASLIDHLLLASRGVKCGSLNLGGISNITIVGPNSPTVAYDIGPASALLDAVVRAKTNGEMEYDESGKIAAKGRVDQGLLEVFLSEPYYDLSFPKSTGKELFHLDYVLNRIGNLDSRPFEDLVATLTALTAETVAAEVRRHQIQELFVAGGGIHNQTMMKMLGERIGLTKLISFEKLGISPDSKEAYLFALIGFLTVHNQPGNIPSSTGAVGPRILGDITSGAQGFHLPAPSKTSLTSLRILR